MPTILDLIIHRYSSPFSCCFYLGRSANSYRVIPTFILIFFITYEPMSPVTETEGLYAALFEALSSNSVLLRPNEPIYTIIAVTEPYLKATGTKKEDLLGKGIFEAFPANNIDPKHTGENDLYQSYKYVLEQKKPHYLPLQRYDLLNEDGSFDVRYWRASNKPVFSPVGDLAFIIHTAEDITDQMKAEQRETQIEGIEKAYELFMQVPSVVGIAKGKELVLELANESAFQLWGKGPEILGKSLRETLPELEGQGIFDLFEKVFQTGKSCSGTEVLVATMRLGIKEIRYFDLFYQPIFDKENKEPIGVFTLSNDVSDKVVAIKKVGESESKYRTLFESMDQGYCTVEIITDDKGDCIDYRFIEINPTFERHVGLSHTLGKKVSELVTNIESKWFDFYGGVAKTGKPIRLEEESVALNKWFDVYAVRVGEEGDNKVGIFFTDVTERKRAERTLEESNERFKNLADESPMFVFIIDADPLAPVSFWNKTWLQYTGQTPEQALGRAWDGIIHPEDIPMVMKHYTPAFERQQPYFIPSVRVKRHDGVYRWYAFKGNPRLDAAGAFKGYIGVGFDVQEQKLAEDALRESEERFRSMADASPVMIWTLDEAGNSTYYNSKAATFTGHNEEEIREGKTWQVAIHPDDIEAAGGVVHHAVVNRTPYQMECRMQRADGAWRWLLNHGTPRFGSKGEYFGFVGSSIDITEQKKSHLELQTALEQMRLSKEAAELGTFDMDLDRGTMHWDDRCRTLFGISHHNDVTYEKDFVTRLHPEDRERIITVIDQLFDKSISNGDYDVEYRTVGAEDGVIRWVRAKGKVYFNAQEKPVRFIGSVLDITEKVTALKRVEALVEERTKELAEANEALLNINKELQRSNQNLEEFAYAASHDLKEPVRKIHFFSNKLKEQLSSNISESEAQSFNRIANATERMGSLIDDLLLYSHVSQRPQETEFVDLNEKVQRVLEDLELDIEERNATIHVGKLPLVKGYRRQLQQLFQNLISNALKYSKANEAPHIDISAGTVTENGQAYHVISVKDNGIGFDQKYSDKIFQMFSRLHARAEYSGTGVGLSIVKKVVQNHNGFIQVASEVGRGSNFNVYLPA